MNKKREKVIAIIIARGGSKSIPRKNVLPLHGKPLIAWSIDLAKSVSRIDRVIVSTDDDEIAEIAKKYGAEVPFKRPSDLAQDETPTLSVLQHCISYLETEECYSPDIVSLLYPTAPFLKKERVEEALAYFENTDCQSVISVVEDYGRFWKRHSTEDTYKVLHPEKRVNRQYYNPLYKENGSIYFSRKEVLTKKKALVDDNSVQFIIMNEDENVDIDNPADWIKAEKTVI